MRRAGADVALPERSRGDLKRAVGGGSLSGRAKLADLGPLWRANLPDRRPRSAGRCPMGKILVDVAPSTIRSGKWAFPMKLGMVNSLAGPAVLAFFFCSFSFLSVSRLMGGGGCPS